MAEKGGQRHIQHEVCVSSLCYALLGKPLSLQQIYFSLKTFVFLQILNNFADIFRKVATN